MAVVSNGELNDMEEVQCLILRNYTNIYLETETETCNPGRFPQRIRKLKFKSNLLMTNTMRKYGDLHVRSYNVLHPALGGGDWSRETLSIYPPEKQLPTALGQGTGWDQEAVLKR